MTTPTRRVGGRTVAHGVNHRLTVLDPDDMRREVNPCQESFMRCTASVEYLAEWEYNGRRRNRAKPKMIPGKRTLCRTHARTFATRYSIPYPEVSIV